MFLKNSRYHGRPTETVTDRQGREVTIVKLRRLPATAGDEKTLPIVSNVQRGFPSRENAYIFVSSEPM